jgi:hypothetical protein
MENASLAVIMESVAERIVYCMTCLRIAEQERRNDLG